MSNYDYLRNTLSDYDHLRRQLVLRLRCTAKRRNKKACKHPENKLTIINVETTKRRRYILKGMAWQYYWHDRIENRCGLCNHIVVRFDERPINEEA